MALTINDQIRQYLASVEINNAISQRNTYTTVSGSTSITGSTSTTISGTTSITSGSTSTTNLTENKNRYVLGEGLYPSTEAETIVRKFRRENYEAMFDELEKLVKEAATKGKTYLEKYYENDDYTEKFDMSTNILKLHYAFTSQGYGFFFNRIEVTDSSTSSNNKIGRASCRERV